MIKLVIKEVLFCDVCGREQYLASRCKACGTEMCGQCWEIHGEIHPSNVYFSNGGDGYYCNLCANRLRSEGDDPLYAAFLKVGELRSEMEQWNKDFMARTAAAEKRLRALLLATSRTSEIGKRKGVSVVRNGKANSIDK